MKIGDRKYHEPAINQIEELSARLIALNRQLEEKNRQLEQSENARKNLFSNITHDLRTPLSAIRGAAERLSQSPLCVGDCLKMVKIIDSRAHTLEWLIEELYLTMLIDQPEFKLSLSNLEITPILEEYFISMEGSGRLDGRKCALCTSDGYSPRVMIDPQYFIRVLDNLFINALRYTNEGDRIELGCRDANDNIEIFIADFGAGIPANDLPHIFDRMYTGAAARTPGKNGSGLGLSIVKSIVEKHGGEIHCESTHGEGATFIISLPPA